MSLEKFIPIKDESQTNNPVDPQGSSCEENEPYVLMVLGDSMLPEFEEGEVIVIQPGMPPQDGNYVVALHNGEYTFRQLVKLDDQWQLKALNDSYPTEPLASLEDVKGVITQKKSPGGRKNRKNYL